MKEESLLEKLRRRAISAKEVRAHFAKSLVEVGPKRDAKLGSEKVRLVELLKKTPDDRLLENAKLLFEEYLVIAAREKENRAKLARAVKEGMGRIIMQHASKYPGKRTPAVAYMPGVGSERLEQKLKKCKTDVCAKEALYELLDLILESSKASFETLKEELVKEIRRAATTFYIGAPDNNGLQKEIEESIDNKLAYYSKAEGEAGEEIPDNIDPSVLMQLALRHPTLLILGNHYPEIAEAFLKYPNLFEDRKIGKYLDGIANAAAKIAILPEAVAEELLKPLKFGDFLYYKLSQC